jgi:putative Holliday junction resolvase
VDNHKHQEFLGVDVGAVRIGIARGNTAARIAEPLKTVPAAQAAAELLDLSDKNQAAGVVVGLPRSLDGAETGQTKAVRQWVQSVKNRINLPFYWQDEALTSQRAESLKPKPEGPGVDAEAAAIILQDFLDSEESDRVAA